MSSPVTKADDLRYSDEGVQAVLRDVLLPLWNAYSFFVTYANLDGASPDGSGKARPTPSTGGYCPNSRPSTEGVTAEFEAYEITRGVDSLVGLSRPPEQLVHPPQPPPVLEIRGRRRQDRGLRHALPGAAPLRDPGRARRSLRHRRDLVQPAPRRRRPVGAPGRLARGQRERRRADLEAKMAGAPQGRHPGPGPAKRAQPQEPPASCGPSTWSPATPPKRPCCARWRTSSAKSSTSRKSSSRTTKRRLVEYGAKANFKVLGQDAGPPHEGSRRPASKPRSAAEIATIVDGSSLHLDLGGTTVELNQESVLVTRTERASLKVLNEGSLTLALDGEVTRELKLEGHLRDVVRAVQNARKEGGLAVSDRIRLSFGGSAVVKETLEEHGDTLREETLALDAVWTDLKQGGGAIEGDTGRGNVPCSPW